LDKSVRETKRDEMVRKMIQIKEIDNYNYVIMSIKSIKKF